MVGLGRLMEVVGCHHHSRPPGRLLGNHLHNALTRHDIQSRYRFIEQQQVGMLGKTLGHEHPLALASRQLGDLAGGEIANVEPIHGPGHGLSVPGPLAAGRPRHHAPMGVAAHAHHLPHHDGQATAHLGGLQDQGHPTAVGTRPIPKHRHHRPRRGVQQTGQQVQQRRLARAVGPDDGCHRTGRNGKSNVINDRPGATPDPDMQCLDGWGHQTSVARPEANGKPVARPAPPHVSHTTPMARTACTRTTNRLAALAVATLLALLVVGAGAPAWGHARVTGSDPADGTRLEEPPRTMTFTFNEDVSATLGGIRIFDREGNRVDRGAGTQPVPSQLTTAVAQDLDPGTYLATYRVVSADGHVITGAVTFAVGTEVNAAEVAGIDEVPSYLRTATIAGNVILYGGALMAIGLAMLLLVVVGEPTQQQQLVRWLRAGVVVAVLGAAIRVVTIAIEATGRGPTVIFDDGVLAAVLRQGGTGWWLVGMFIGLAALVAGTSLRAGVARQMLIAYGALVAAGSFALTGHTSTGEPLVLLLAMTTLHMLVAAVWLGGLVGVVVLVATSRSTTTPSVATVVSRFSTLALVAVATLWVSGAVQAWWTVGDPTDLFSSSYGRLLLAKLGLVVITMALAAWNRWRLVPAVKAQPAGDQPSGDQPSGDAHRTLARTVRWELVVLALVVVVTSVLVDTPPSRYDTPGAQPFSETISVTDDLELQLLITPGAAGRNELHVTYIDAMGLLDDSVESVTLEMSLPDVDIGPITTNAVQLDPGHYLLTTDRLTVAGTWTIEVVTRIGAFDQQRSTFTVPIGT